MANRQAKWEKAHLGLKSVNLLSLLLSLLQLFLSAAYREMKVESCGEERRGDGVRVGWQWGESAMGVEPRRVRWEWAEPRKVQILDPRQTTVALDSLRLGCTGDGKARGTTNIQ